MSALLAILAEQSKRPRYTFMVLNLIAQVARPDGSAGPLVAKDGGLVLLRDWLCDALTPMAARDPRRRALQARVRDALVARGSLPDDAAAAGEMVEEEMRERLRSTGKTAISRAVSELVAAGLLRRHYQGYRVDHENRGAQRRAVYTLSPSIVRLLRPRSSPTEAPRQRELAF